MGTCAMLPAHISHAWCFACLGWSYYVRKQYCGYLLAHRVDDTGCLALYNICLVVLIRIAMEMEAQARVTVVYLGRTSRCTVLENFPKTIQKVIISHKLLMTQKKTSFVWYYTSYIWTTDRVSYLALVHLSDHSQAIYVSLLVGSGGQLPPGYTK